MTLAALEQLPDESLHALARRLGLAPAADLPRRDLLYDILGAQADADARAEAVPERRRRPTRERRPIAPTWPAYMQGFDPAGVSLDGLIRKTGVLELLPDGYGFLRSAEFSYAPSADDIYVSPSQIKRFSLRLGDTVDGQIRPPKEGERFFALLRVHSVNGRAPEDFTERTGFDFLTPAYPDRPLRLGDPAGAPAASARAARLVDAVAPIGKGQRAVLTAPPQTGATTLVQHLADALTHAEPEATVLVLLVDERPEDVGLVERGAPGAEVIATTLGEPPDRQVHVAELVLEKARRLVEAGRDVVLFVDSLPTLARAYAAGGSGPAGGLDAAALRGPKRVLGSARAVEEGGSLTVVAVVRAETGSAVDEAVAEAFAGTATTEIRLDRGLAAQGLFPAVDVARSGTRREELLVGPDSLAARRALRAALAAQPPADALRALVERLDATTSNDALFDAPGGGTAP